MDTGIRKEETESTPGASGFLNLNQKKSKAKVKFFNSRAYPKYVVDLYCHPFLAENPKPGEVFL